MCHITKTPFNMMASLWKKCSSHSLLSREVKSVLLGIVALGIICGCNSSGRALVSSSPQFDGQQLVNTPGFRLKASFIYAIPLDGRSIQLTFPYKVEVRNDSLFSYLPYYGESEILKYEGDEGLNFNAPLRRINVTNNTKKGFTTYHLEVQKPEQLFFYEMEVYGANQAVKLRVKSQYNTDIRFEGHLD